MITEGHLGRRLKKTSISAIERSVESDRRRVFTVQEVVAFAPTFDVAALWFLIPPPDQNLALEGFDGPLMQLWRIVVGTDRQAEDIKERLTELASENPSAPKEVARPRLTSSPASPSATSRAGALTVSSTWSRRSATRSTICSTR